jgi:cold shock CspA family protein
VTKGRITKLANTFGSTWGWVRPDRALRDVFFNLESLVNPADFTRLVEGDLVEFEEEAERSNGMRAINMSLVALQPAD